MIQVKAEVTYTVTMDKEQAGRIERSLGRALTAMEHLELAHRTQLVNTGTVDDLLGLRTALINAAEGLGNGV